MSKRIFPSDIEKDLTWSEKYLIKLNKDKQALTKLNEFIEDNNISCKEDISQIDSINEQCVDLVAELVEIIKGDKKRMTIDEVIEKYKEITNPNTICLAHCDMFCDKCVQESEQLVEWLEELKALRDNNYKDFYYDKGYSKAENDYHKQSEKDRQSAYELGYINAINDFKKEIIDMVNNSPTVENNSGEIRPMNIEEICEIITERLKK